MRIKQYVILIAVLAAALAAVFGIRAFKSSREKAEAKKQEEETVYACKFEADGVTSFSYQYDGQTLTFERTEDGWKTPDDETAALDADAVDTVIDTFSSVTAGSVISDVSDLSEYGLDAPTQVMSISFSDGSVKTLSFGMENQVVGGQYLQVGGDANVYLVDSTYTETTLNQNLEDLTEEPEEDTEESAEDAEENPN